MAKTVLIIGVGAGDPDYVTMQAVKALNRVDAFFLMDKGASKDKLIAVRKLICERFITGRAYRFVDGTNPERERGVDDYEASIGDLNARKQAVFERMIADDLADGECGGILVWGDPMLYDSTIRIVEAIAASGRHDFSWEVAPGISAVQALAARHRTPLNQIGRAVEITTGRKLAQGFPAGVDTVVVMLDAENTYLRYADDDSLDIYWGAYVGTPDEILIAGKLKDVAAEIERVRAAARTANGWIMDTYMLRRRGA